MLFVMETTNEKVLNSGNTLALPKDYELHNRYVIDVVLGAGGFGITYKAYDKMNQIFCAIKEYVPLGICMRAEDGILLLPVNEDAAKHYDHGKMRFMEEAGTLLEVANIPNIVRITDYFEGNGTAYYVMEYLEGSNVSKLTKFFPNGRLPYDTALQILYAVGNALDKVHTRRFLLHRDISPENIIITKDEKIKLIDFGSAKHIVRQKNQHFTIVLKPHFAPPEQYRSDTRQGNYTDVYALASTFYYMICGKKLPDSMERVAGETYTPAYQIVEEMPLRQSIVLDKALHLDYKKRYQSIHQFLEEMRQDESGNTRSLIVNDGGIQDVKKLCIMHTNLQNELITWPLVENVSYSVGRAKDKDICIAGYPQVSKLHCYVQYDSQSGQYLLKDVSTNGIIYSGKKLKKNQVYAFARGSSVILAGVCEIKMN